MEESPQPPPSSPRSRRRYLRWALSILAAGIALVVVGVVATIAFLLSESGLPFVVARVVAQSDGRLSVEGASGSLGGTMHFARLSWRGPDSSTTATDVVVEWQPLALFSSHLAIRGLGARQITLAVKPSTGATQPPSTLALPLAVDIDHVAISELDWQVGPRAGSVTGIEFGYSGTPSAHRVRDLRLVSELGALAGAATLQADAPFALDGSVAVTGSGPIDGARLDAKLSGTLTEVFVDAAGSFRGATLRGRVAATPFRGIFESATLALGNADLSAFLDTLPHTRLALELDVRPQSNGLSGSFGATNAETGTLADARIPIAKVAGRYSLADGSLALTDLAIELAGGGSARGDATIDVAARDAPSRWRLDVRDLDLAQLHPALTRTSLTGWLRADIDGNRQRLEGDLTQASLAVAFAASYADRRLDVTRFRAQASGGTLSGTGRVEFNASRPFEVAVTAAHFDPARLTALKPGVLDGTIKASGTLAPEWKANVDVALAKGSRYAGVAVSGSLRGTFTRHTAAQVALDLAAASAHLMANGSAGTVGDRLAFVLNAPRLADIAPLLPAASPQPIGGKVIAKGAVALEPAGVGGDVDFDAGALQIGSALVAEKLAFRSSFAPGGAQSAPVPLAARPLSLEASATNITVEQTTLASARVDIHGTLSSHAATLAARGDGIDAHIDVAGGALAVGESLAATRWSGTINALANAGKVPVKLLAPAQLELGANHLRLAGARIAVADGSADVGELLYDNGRLTSQGAFTAIALDSVATLSGRPLPFASTLTLNGSWSIVAQPRLSGTDAVRRAAGDVLAIPSDPARGPDLGVGIEALDLEGSLHDDALDAKLGFRSSRGGSMQGTLSLGAVPGAPPGRIAPNAPLAFALNAELASLALLQPWLGTSVAMNGNASVAMGGSGTLDARRFSGTLAGNALKIDAPQYGVALTDGRIRAHLADGGIAIDEIAFTGGNGRFTASGRIGPRSGASDAGTQIAWQAENFRVTNRPNLRLVVGGNGTLRVVERRLALAGKINVIEGQMEYEPAPPGELGSDVVVVGRETRIERANTIADLPLSLDVDVDFGQKLHFEGSGLDTSLRGSVHVKTSPSGYLTGQGTINAVNGTYYAFGQKLTIDRGRLIFDGPLDNPALDVVALRKNLQVEAGVEVTGTVKVPRVRITSNPAVPENEALSWLITGQPLSTGSSSDYSALAAASAALLSKGGKPVSTEIAERLGLDDISVRSGGIGAAGTTGTTGQVIVFGKRISDRLTLGYEQGLSVAANALRLEYALTKTLTVRAEAGTVSGIGLYYRRTYN